MNLIEKRAEQAKKVQELRASKSSDKKVINEELKAKLMPYFESYFKNLGKKQKDQSLAEGAIVTGAVFSKKGKVSDVKVSGQKVREQSNIIAFGKTTDEIMSKVKSMTENKTDAKFIATVKLEAKKALTNIISEQYLSESVDQKVIDSATSAINSLTEEKIEPKPTIKTESVQPAQPTKTIELPTLAFERAKSLIKGAK